MGFEIMVNFNLPYFSTNPKEFWQRWHISLSSWLKDYLYIPLGGSKKGPRRTYVNLLLTMLLGGLWHGAGWLFLAWGAYQGLLLVFHRLAEPVLAKLPSIKNRFLERSRFVLGVVFFFHLWCLGWPFFRGQSVSQAFSMFHALIFNLTAAPGQVFLIVQIVFFTGLLVLIEVIQYRKDDLMIVMKAPVLARALLYIVIFFLLEAYGVWHAEEFIYFQF
jgi:D-alanyl-lipoteichoic acid acyltransferase DltB (MBOAT superfamily)